MTLKHRLLLVSLLALHCYPAATQRQLMQDATAGAVSGVISDGKITVWVCSGYNTR
jgi:hypothetical protein